MGLSLILAFLLGYCWNVIIIHSLTFVRVSFSSSSSFFFFFFCFVLFCFVLFFFLFFFLAETVVDALAEEAKPHILALQHLKNPQALINFKVNGAKGEVDGLPGISYGFFLFFIFDFLIVF